MKLIFIICFAIVAFCAQATEIGVYYFPGWSKGISPSPWDKITAYPDRKPMLGWYDERDPKFAKAHYSWMVTYGIDYIVYDWYWEEERGLNLNHAIDNFISHSDGFDLKFSILWANHSSVPRSLNEFDEIVKYWCDHYFGNSKFLKTRERPTVFIFSPDGLESRANSFGYTTKQLFERANSYVDKRGFGGVEFIAVSHAVADRVNVKYFNSGYGAVTGYNYHFGLSNNYNPAKPPSESHSYEELLAGYDKTWNWFLGNSKLPYILPLTSGWDKRPWGGSADPLHDNSGGDPVKFDFHLREALRYSNKAGKGRQDRVIICCWNEFGEGSYIEPTEKFGFDFLESIRKAKNEASLR